MQMSIKYDTIDSIVDIQEKNFRVMIPVPSYLHDFFIQVIIKIIVIYRSQVCPNPDFIKSMNIFKNNFWSNNLVYLPIVHTHI